MGVNSLTGKVENKEKLSGSEFVFSPAFGYPDMVRKFHAEAQSRKTRRKGNPKSLRLGFLCVFA
jgi:hypothetical protein